jgi:outer membrane protein OmpA-like peptidoglycan-associated protein
MMARLDLDGLDGALATAVDPRPQAAPKPQAAIASAKTEVASAKVEIAPNPPAAMAPTPIATRPRTRTRARRAPAMLAALCLLLVVGAALIARRLPRQHPAAPPAADSPSAATVLAATRPPVVAATAPDPRAPDPSAETGWTARFPGTFSFNDAAPTDVDDGALRDLARDLSTRCRGAIAVIGHTCNRGTTDANHRMGLRRAAEVVRLLAASGVDRTRMHVDDAGSEDPVASNRSPEGRAANRRVEIACQP